MSGRYLTDEQIINGFRRFDPDITKTYFYGYCRTAYGVMDHRYQLRHKSGMDFYSLAHDYYIQLLVQDFRQLDSRSQGMKLSAWMTGGFRFVVLEALKKYQAEAEWRSDAMADDVLEFVRDTDVVDPYFLQDVADAVCEHYTQDRRMQEIAHMLLTAGFKQKEVAEQLGMTPSAVNQRYRKMMEEVVVPYVMENYSEGISYGGRFALNGFSDDMLCERIEPRRSLFRKCMYEEERPVSGLKGLAAGEESVLPWQGRITPEKVFSLQPDQIFVFGSNLHGIHAGGPARTARFLFGAVMGQGVGMQGQSYAIPTMQGGVDTIRPYVNEFLQFARQHPEYTFLVTPIGCGLAGFEPEDIAPLFRKAVSQPNIHLPRSFWTVLVPD